MAPDLFDAWYFIVGFLLGNGMPHFAFGRGGKIFRSPFGQRSPPRVNVLWGVANFVLATVLGLLLTYLGLYDAYSLLSLLLGFWLMVLQFGVGMRRFLND